MSCVVCGQPGTPTTRALNGLPLGVVACDDCREAVGRREVGVVIRPDDSLHITDGRAWVHADNAVLACWDRAFPGQHWPPTTPPTSAGAAALYDAVHDLRSFLWIREGGLSGQD